MSEALRPSPGREVLPPGAKPDVPVAPAVAPPPVPGVVTIEERLRRCAPNVSGTVVRLSDDIAYAAETTASGPVIVMVRRAAAESVCERYEVPAAAPRVTLAGSVVALATATGSSPSVGSVLLVELGADGAVRAVTLVDGACARGSTLHAVRLFADAPSLELRCWISSERSWTAIDQMFYRSGGGWQSLLASESGQVVRSPTNSTPPVNAVLPGSIRVLETGANPRLEVATSGFDVRTGMTKFTRVVMRWNDAQRRFEPSGAPVVERRGGT